MKLTNCEILDYAKKLQNWTPNINGCSLADFQAAGRFHTLVVDNFLRLYGENLQQLDPELHSIFGGVGHE